MRGPPILDLGDYEPIRVIGQGAFADITLQKHIDSGRVVVVKQYSSSHRSDEAEADFIKEAAILYTLDFPSIIKLYGFFDNGDRLPLSLALEYAEHGSLESVLTDVQMGIEHEQFGPTERMMVLYGVAFALKYLHGEVRDPRDLLDEETGTRVGKRSDMNVLEIAHRDVKSGNVLLDAEWKPKLTDFGFAKVLTPDVPNTPCRGSWPWMAPEVMRGESYSAKADVYSFGMLVYEVVTNLTPFVHCHTSRQIIQEVSVENKRPIFPDPAIPLAMLAAKCWDADPDKRPAMRYVTALLITMTMALPGTDLDRLFNYAIELEGK